MLKKVKNTNQATLCMIFFFALFFNHGTVWPDSLQNVLRVGWEEWKPYMFSDTGKMAGLDIEVLQAVAEKSGFTLEYTEVPWPRFLQKIEKGELDIASAATKTKQRQQWAYFTQPYRIEQFVMVFRGGEGKEYSLSKYGDIMNYSDFQLGICRNMDYGSEFMELMHKKEFAVHTQETVEEKLNIRKLLQNRITACLYADIYAAYWAAMEQNVENKIEIHPIKLTYSECSIMISKKSMSPEIVGKLNSAIDELKKSGTLEKIMEKYLGKH
ncbi:MAG: amino acid ABC transporter substrate-binding protein [Chitinivibrionales bacterium]|nr:amino acid ABC transporter substrate-binding protein [Chitinivibrionales bacterium]